MVETFDLGRLIEALSQPAAYPFAVEAVTVCQTHISAVFLAGPYAYKIKKPVRFSFLDFSTLEKRRHYCEEEVRLNRRLAPDVYLGVVPIAADAGRLHVEGAGQPLEWAVKMQRLPEEATLQQRLRHGQVPVELVESFARRLARFHQLAERTPAMAAFGRFDAVGRNLLDIFSQSLPQIGTTVSRAVFERLRSLTESALASNRDRIDARAAGGRTCDTHGDLHLDHVYWFPERPPPGDLVIVDCIEFNERFRYTDAVADMAFAAMDFAYHGRRDLGRAFAEAYFAASGDDDGRPLLPMYTAYRASVRGSVMGLKLAEKEIPEAERGPDLQNARGHWLLALVELERPDYRPCLVLVGGLPGTGKSTLAHALAEQARFQLIRSDVVRKELAQRFPAGDIYTPEWNERTYAACLDRVERHLFEGQRVLVDATFREESLRRRFLETARCWGVPALWLVAEAPAETVRDRLAQRQGDASDADWSIYQRLAHSWQEPGELSRLALRPIATSGPVAEAVRQALNVLRAAGLA